MHIRYGYCIELVCEQATPIITMLDVHPDRRNDIIEADEMHISALAGGGAVSDETYDDQFGNICRRVMAPPGGLRLEAGGLIRDSGLPDPADPSADALSPEKLPSETLIYLLGSRYCETDALSEQAWSLFGSIPGGWQKVQAVCDFVHERIKFDYMQARATRTAAEAFHEGVGVCRDYAHLALTLCRCLNIPARYCTGYLGDIGVPRSDAPGDFSGWFEAYLGNRWWTFDARHNIPRIGRILIARGRDATDVPIVNTFGPHTLGRFEIVTDEEGQAAPAQRSSDYGEQWTVTSIAS